MDQKPTTTIRISPSVKAEANAVFKELGITLSAAVNAFLATVARTGAVPFDLSTTQDNLTIATLNKPKNASLNRAFKEKKDEFYTQYEDVEKEVVHYFDQFIGKQVLCNCDDPFESAFFRYFLVNFARLGLASLTSICFASSPLAGQGYRLEGDGRAYIAIVKDVPADGIILPDGSLDLDALFEMPDNSISWLEGNGDFRSLESISYLENADIVVTNPPFSLFREYIAQLIEYNKQFLILGNMNAVTYREVFPFFRDNKIWYGQSIRSGDRKFHVPDSYPLSASNCGIDDSGRRFIRVKGVRWFTNLDNSRRHEDLILTKTFHPAFYPKYDNYSAIEVNRTQNIPFDYFGLMGVPITFLDRYNPRQFEIVMLANGNARTNVDASTLSKVGYSPDPEDRGGVAMIDGQRSYVRILLRRIAE